MTENFYKTWKTDHTKFGGLIYPSDFNTDYRKKNNKSSNIASRIISDAKFDNNLKKISKNKTKKGYEK